MRILVLMVLGLIGLVVTALVSLCFASLPKFSATLGAVMVQDVMVFIAPAVLMSFMFFKKPWKQMCVDKAPSWRGIMLAVVVYVVSLPALNWLVDWNEHVHLPQSMAALERSFRVSEDAAQQMTRMLLSETDVLPMLCSLFVVGIMAGLSEEMVFRGAILRTMRGGGRSHMAVWVVAIAFSAFHMQFFGFFPRMLLGAWLGYLLVWTGSLWVPVIAHALNNSMVVLLNYAANVGVIDVNSFEKLGVTAPGEFPVLAIASAVATAAVIAASRRWLLPQEPTE